MTLAHILRDVAEDQDDRDSSSSGVSPPLSRRSSVSSAFFDENEFNFLARRRQGLKSPITKSPSEPLSTEEEASPSPPPPAVPAAVPAAETRASQPSKRPGLIRTVVREMLGIVVVEHWLLLQDVALCVWRYVKRVAGRLDNCRVATFGLLQALA